MFKVTLESKTPAAVPVGTLSYPLAGLPDVCQGGIAFLDKFRLDVNISDFDNAGGDSTSDLLWDMFTVTMSDGTEPWGPVELRGTLIEQSRYLATGMTIPYQGNTNGDATVSAGTNATRRFSIEYDLSAYGGTLGDYSPANVVLKNGNVKISLANPTNATNIVQSVSLVCIGHGEETARAVPRIQTTQLQLPSLTYNIEQAGAFLQHWLQNAATFVAADISKAQVKVGGLPVLADVEPFGAITDLANLNGGATATAKTQNTFMDVIGGSFPRGLPLFGSPRRKLSGLPIGRGINVNLTGSESAANLVAATTHARYMDITEANRQFALQGAPPAADYGDVNVRTADGGGISPRLQGYVSVKRS
jgi:hypothetical protein